MSSCCAFLSSLYLALLGCSSGPVFCGTGVSWTRMQRSKCPLMSSLCFFTCSPPVLWDHVRFRMRSKVTVNCCQEEWHFSCWQYCKLNITHCQAAAPEQHTFDDTMQVALPDLQSLEVRITTKNPLSHSFDVMGQISARYLVWFMEQFMWLLYHNKRTVLLFVSPVFSPKTQASLVELLGRLGNSFVFIFNNWLCKMIAKPLYHDTAAGPLSLLRWWSPSVFLLWTIYGADLMNIFGSFNLH